ncbi:hypothetical protein F5Y07DRAFT_241021 [Xylaria sp. FL0933]|nr:hypothetical protein F5Y07DRAFT_241021 [Xylaria sp. FL0933]
MSLDSDQARYLPRRAAHKTEELPQPWTTARCHRLLRPLVSRIASMRKDMSSAGPSMDSRISQTSGTALGSSMNRNGHREELDSEAGSLMTRKKRPRLTYSQRRGTQASQSQGLGSDQIHSGQGNRDEDASRVAETKSDVRKAFRCVQPDRQQKATAPGEIIPSTPILRRARGNFVLSPVAPVHGLDPDSNRDERGRERLTKTNSSAEKRLEERLVNLRPRLCFKYADLEAIYRSLEALLKATAASTLDDTTVARGTRSLLEMCLRRIPHYITELDAWARLDAEEAGTISTLDDIDTSAEIYNELESLGTNVGWRHLRVVVRADGLSAVKRAMEEGLFDDEFSELIIDLCVQLGAASEAEDLVATLVNRQYPQPTSTENRFSQLPALRPLMVLNSFSGKTQRTSFWFRQYSMLLSSGSLPIDWLATSEFERIWSLAVQGLADHHPCCDAISFISQSIILLCCQKRTFNGSMDTAQLERDMARASQRTLMSILSILVSMCLLGDTSAAASRRPRSDSRQAGNIGDKSNHIIRACINQLKSYRRTRGTQKLGILYLALFLLLVDSQAEKIAIYVRGGLEKLPPPITASLSTKDIRMRNHYDNIAWFIASIARACGRATSVASHQCLHELFGRLKSLKLGQDLLDNLKAATAFSIAQQTNNVKDLIYAESLHPHVGLSSSARGHKQSDNTLFTGYRWEETIGEWVTVSPVMKKRRAPILRKHLGSSTTPKVQESSFTRSSNPTSPVPDSPPKAKISLCQEETSEGEHDTKKRTRQLDEEQGMNKRPRRLRSAETLTTRRATEVLPPQQGLAISAALRRPKSQIDPEKENRVRLLAKKPRRRSSGRTVLGTRSMSCDPVVRRDTYSEDELCI